MRDLLLAFRHAPAAESGRCYGRLDVEVHPPSEEAARRLEAQVHFQPSTVFTSPSARCRAPASLLARRWGAALDVDDRLYELDFGAWEGVPWAELHGKAAFEAWARDWKTGSPPGGEPLSLLEARVLSWWAEAKSCGPAVLVGHAGVLRALLVQRRGLSWEEAMALEVPHLGPGLVFEMED